MAESTLYPIDHLDAAKVTQHQTIGEAQTCSDTIMAMKLNTSTTPSKIWQRETRAKYWVGPDGDTRACLATHPAPARASLTRPPETRFFPRAKQTSGPFSCSSCFRTDQNHARCLPRVVPLKVHPERAEAHTDHFLGTRITEVAGEIRTSIEDQDIILSLIQSKVPVLDA